MLSWKFFHIVITVLTIQFFSLFRSMHTTVNYVSNERWIIGIAFGILLVGLFLNSYNNYIMSGWQYYDICHESVIFPCVIFPYGCAFQKYVDDTFIFVMDGLYILFETPILNVMNILHI